jgi:hypothetical protein
LFDEIGKFRTGEITDLAFMTANGSQFGFEGIRNI